MYAGLASIIPQSAGDEMMQMLLSLYIKMQNLLEQENGQDLVEYALIVALIALACTAGLKSLASVISNAFFQNAAGVINNAYSN